MIDRGDQQTSPSNSQGPSPGASRKSSVLSGKSNPSTKSSPIEQKSFFQRGMNLNFQQKTISPSC